MESKLSLIHIFEVAHAEVVGAVQHTAVGIAAAVDHVAVTLGGGHEHAGAILIRRFRGILAYLIRSGTNLRRSRPV